MIFLKDYYKLVADKLKFKFISNSLVVVTYNKDLYTILDKEDLKGLTNDKDLLLMQKIIDTCIDLNTEYSRDEIDRFIGRGFINENKDSKHI